MENQGDVLRTPHEQPSIVKKQAIRNFGWLFRKALHWLETQEDGLPRNKGKRGLGQTSIAKKQGYKELWRLFRKALHWLEAQEDGLPKRRERRSLGQVSIAKR